MTKTIAINAGSSSLKWQLYEMPDEVVLAKGLIERIGLKDSVSTVKFDDRSESQTLDIADVDGVSVDARIANAQILLTIFLLTILSLIAVFYLLLKLLFVQNHKFLVLFFSKM